MSGAIVARALNDTLGTNDYKGVNSYLKEINDSLVSIATALDPSLKANSWEGIQYIVQHGLAPTLIPVGTHLKIDHTEYGELTGIVVDHDYLKSVENPAAHTMTVMLLEPIDITYPFSARNALYKTKVSENLLSNTSYGFRIEEPVGLWSAGDYHFSPTNTINGEKWLTLQKDPQNSMVNNKVEFRGTPKYPTANESNNISTTATIYSSTAINKLQINNLYWVGYGSDNYSSSAIRKFLNSESESNWYIPYNDYDIEPSENKNLPGFLNGIDSELLQIIGKVKVPCCFNDYYDENEENIGGNYYLEDKVYLPSYKEIKGNDEDFIDDGSKVLDYYKGTTNIEQIKYIDDYPVEYLTRTPAKNGCFIASIGEDGNKLLKHPNKVSSMICPMFTIV